MPEKEYILTETPLGKIKMVRLTSARKANEINEGTSSRRKKAF